MDEDRWQLLVTASVFTGALILTGPLTFALIYGVVGFLADLVGLSGLYESQIGTVVVGVPAVLIAGEVVTEIAALQLHGIDALNRGNRRQRLLRHGVLGMVVVAAVIFLVTFLVNVSVEVSRPSTQILVGLAVLALLWGGFRTVRAFRSGYAGLGEETGAAGQ